MLQLPRRLALLTGVVSLACAASAAPAQADPVAFVETLVRAEARNYSNTGNGYDHPPPPFGPRMIELNRRYAESPEKLIGPLLHPWFGPSILPNTPITVIAVRSIRKSDDAAVVAVDFHLRNYPLTSTFHLIPSESSWLVDNVEYGNGDYDSLMNDLIAGRPIPGPIGVPPINAIPKPK